MTEQELKDYLESNGADQALNILLLLGPDQFDGDYDYWYKKLEGLNV